MCYWSGRLPYAKRLRLKSASVLFGVRIRLKLRCRIFKKPPKDKPKVQKGSLCHLPGVVSWLLTWLSLLLFALTPSTPQGLATFVRVVPVAGSQSSEPVAPDLTPAKPKQAPPSSLMDVLMMFETPHLDFRRIPKQRNKLLRSLRFSHSRRKRKLAAMVASTDLKAELWPHRTVTSVATQKVVYLSKDHPTCNVPVVVDTGASFSIRCFISNFVTPIVSTSSKEMKGMSASVKIK